MTPVSPGADSRRMRGNQVAIGGTVKLTPGGVAELLNVSATGALVESRHRLATGTTVMMSIDGERPQRLHGSVVRSTVTAIHRDSSMTYQLGIAFNPGTTLDGVVEEQDPVSAEAASPSADASIAPAVPVALANEW
jgi:hypothetical protein